MSSVYRFDVNVSPIAMYEWDDGVWEQETLSLNESLTLNDDGTITLLETHSTYHEVKTFALTPSAEDGADVYYRVSEAYTLPDGTPIGSEPEDEGDDDHGGDDGIDDDVDDDGSTDDDIPGSDDDDSQHGGLGDDSVSGGLGDDDLYGDEGDDDLYGDDGHDSLIGGAGFDVLLGGVGNDDLSGGDDDDLLEGDDGDDSLDGGDGDDELYAGTGDDSVQGGAGDDLIIGGNGAGNDSYAGGDGVDTVRYTSATAGIMVNLSGGMAKSKGADAGIGKDKLASIENVIGGDFADVLIGSAGNNELTGGAGNDSVNGGNGDDLIIDGAGSGNDKYVGGGGADTVDYSGALAAITVNLQSGSAGSTSTDAGIGTDKLAGVENVIGGAFDDSLNGSALANLLDGGEGNDTLAGGLGKDTLTGGLGADVFRFGKAVDAGLGQKSDVITDFDGLGGDLIDLSAIDAKVGVAGNDAFTLLAEAPAVADASGMLWFVDGILYGSTDKDAAAELQIELTGVTSLAVENIVL